MDQVDESLPWLQELSDCQLCEWHCGVDRLAGEVGVCRIGLPQVASRTLHPAPPESYTIFMGGCNFRCLYCQNWDIAHFPDSGGQIDGWVDPAQMAREAVAALHSPVGRQMGADRLFFSGGCPTCSLPYVEQVVYEARQIDPRTRVNFDTNGFMTPDSLARVLELTTSITFDIRAVDEQVHRALTGAPPGPVLRNAQVVAQHPDKLWEFRVLVVPGMNDSQIEPICRFLADLDPALPVCFLAFRPNFVLERHPGASLDLMRQAVTVARDCGLRQVNWAGHPGLPGKSRVPDCPVYSEPGAALAGTYAQAVGCTTHPRNCGGCSQVHCCPVKSYRPMRRT